MTTDPKSLALATALAVTAASGEPQMTITSSGSRTPIRGAAATFTGVVEVEPLFGATDHTRATAGQVTFSPCARSAWHTHPAGQHLLVMSGVGWV